MCRRHGWARRGERLVAAVPHGPYVEQQLAPVLRPGDVVVMDLSSNKVQGVRRAIEAAGADLLYLPPYSPDLDPIEMAFATFSRCCAPKPCARAEISKADFQ